MTFEFTCVNKRKTSLGIGGKIVDLFGKGNLRNASALALFFPDLCTLFKL